ncbi:MAG: hypothetical protein ABIG44_04145 [Planctomycetota bacterium]
MNQMCPMVLAAGVAFMCCGCGVEYRAGEGEGEKGGDAIYMAGKVRLGIEAMSYKTRLGSRIQTTAVHPADAGFLTGATATEPDRFHVGNEDRRDGDEDDNREEEDQLNWAPTVGVFGSVGTEALRAVVGLSGRVNLLAGRTGYREGLYSVRKQHSDMRSDSNASYVFTQVWPGPAAFIPSAGLESRIGPVFLAGEVGFPYQEWNVRSGHDRGGRWQTVQRDSWTGWGIRYAGTVGVKDDDTTYFVTGAYEDFGRVKFAGQRGDISGITVMFGMMVEW